MKDRIEKQVNRVIGKQLGAIGRASNMLWLSFGSLRTVRDMYRKDREVGEFALHIQCAWRITEQKRILVGSGDIYEPSSSWEGDYDSFEWDVQGNNLFDERVSQLIKEKQDPLIVKNVEADIFGGFKIWLTDNVMLEAFPNGSGYGELWRFFIPFENEEKHFVVSADGISLE